MSYSLSVRGATAAAALAAAAVRFDQIVEQQSPHEVDKKPAMDAAEAFAALLPAHDNKDVAITMSGSLGGTWDQGKLTMITSANVNVTVSLVDKLPVET